MRGEELRSPEVRGPGKGRSRLAVVRGIKGLNVVGGRCSGMGLGGCGVGTECGRRADRKCGRVLG